MGKRLEALWVIPSSVSLRQTFENYQTNPNLLSERLLPSDASARNLSIIRDESTMYFSDHVLPSPTNVLPRGQLYFSVLRDIKQRRTTLVRQDKSDPQA